MNERIRQLYYTIFQTLSQTIFLIDFHCELHHRRMKNKKNNTYCSQELCTIIYVTLQVTIWKNSVVCLSELEFLKIYKYSPYLLFLLYISGRLVCKLAQFLFYTISHDISLKWLVRFLPAKSSDSMTASAARHVF